jgi:hypothetical protein
MSGVLAPAPDGSEPAAVMDISGTLRCLGPYERATVSASGGALSGDWTRSLTAAECDALTREWAASGQSWGHLWLRDWGQRPSVAARATWRSGLIFGFGVFGAGAWAFTLRRVAKKAAWFRVNNRALRRAAAGLCPGCGYDLRGVAVPRCPECGADPWQVVSEAKRALGPYTLT